MNNTNLNTGNEILFITSYPPRACGIATYSQDLIEAIREKFGSFSLKVCALQEDNTTRNYPEEVKYILNSSDFSAYLQLAKKINEDEAIKIVFVQHEFGLYGGQYGEFLLSLLHALEKPALVTFHTVLPKPDGKRKKTVQAIVDACAQSIVMTKHSSALLQKAYEIGEEKITIIPHGTHMVSWKNKLQVKKANHLENRLVLTTFGLLSPNKSIETALDALPKIVEKFPNVLYLILGKTHPGVVRNEGEIYRESLESKVDKLGLRNNVQFVNKYLSLAELLEYLRLTDVYLFTSKDPNQAVSGTFAYAMSSACPVISTPIPHAVEMLNDNAGIIVDFQNPEQLSNATIRLLENKALREEFGLNAFHQTRASVWENAAISHAKVFNRYLDDKKPLLYNTPKINLDHIHSLTDQMGMIQFSIISDPDINSGYTLDDNARALIAICLHYDQTRDAKDLDLITTYLNFIDHCQQPEGDFLNYVDIKGNFHDQNNYTNLEDSNGRAIWALGTTIAHHEVLPSALVDQAEAILRRSLVAVSKIKSPRAIAFAIKGLYQAYQKDRAEQILHLLDGLASVLQDKYFTVSDSKWKWFEEYLTYANSVLPEAMLYAYLATKRTCYKETAITSFDFLLYHLFKAGSIRVISNRGWLQKGSIPNRYGEQPIELSYTIQALDLFYQVFNNKSYLKRLEIAFNWFLGNNHLNQIIYNPLTGGCCDGLEKDGINLNQGAESTVCYLIARLIVEKNKNALRDKRAKRVRLNKKKVFGTHQLVPKIPQEAKANPVRRV
ncbi:MAG: glycosyltransferase [Reichenbachiella sp.]|uniref:glycosyltransferase n=1 Tax=Reichenbachiella sp. TaxID=2184521 RepID=UPI003266C0DE